MTSKSYPKILTSKSIQKLLRILCFWLKVCTREKFKKHCFTGFMLISVTDRRHGQTNPRFCHLQPSDMDFSENYTCVEQDEIQSAHCNKISVFIAVCWVSGQTESCALISDYREHDKYFCGHCNQTIIADLKRKCSLHTIDFFTDDAASQFKQKYTLNNMTLIFNDIECTWHFFCHQPWQGGC